MGKWSVFTAGWMRDREWVSGKNDDKFTNPLGGFMRPKPKSKPKK